MVKTRFEGTIVLLLAILIGTAWIVISRESVAEKDGSIVLADAPIVGHPAPDFTLQTAVGQTITLSKLVASTGAAGQPVVLNFWASWCGPCRIEMPNFQQVSVQFNGRIAFIGINQGEDSQTVTDFGNEFGVTYPLLVDQNNRVNHLYGVTGLPTTLFIDQKGIVREVVIGNMSKAVLQDRIGSLLAEASGQ